MADDRLSNDLASLKIDRAAKPARRFPRTLIYVVIAAALAAVVYFVVVPAARSRLFKTEVAVTEISLVSAAQGSIQLTATGYVVPQKTAKVASKVAGRIAEVNFAEGDLVEKGQVIAKIEDFDAQATLNSAKSRAAAARARVATAKAQLAETQQLLEREKQLVDRGVSPKAVAEDLAARVASLSAAVKAALADVNAADAEVKTLEVNAGNYLVLAPITGYVVGTPAKVGEMVDLTLMAPLVELIDFKSSVVEVDVPESRIAQVEEGAPCQIVLDSNPTRPFKGSVQLIGRRVNRSKATVTVKIKFDEEPVGAIADSAARVNFLNKKFDQQATTAPPKLIVPASAVTERNGAKVVWVIDNGKVSLRIIEIGAEFGGGFLLTTKIPPGTKVVANPPPDLTDGQKIKEKAP